jgi:hypothetical protein
MASGDAGGMDIDTNSRLIQTQTLDGILTASKLSITRWSARQRPAVQTQSAMAVMGKRSHLALPRLWPWPTAIKC